MKHQQVLEQAKSLLKRGWAQHCVAVNNEGEVCNPTNSRAVSWCITGAIQCAMNAEGKEFYQKHLKPVYSFLESKLEIQGKDPGDALMEWNDDSKRTLKQVLELLS